MTIGPALPAHLGSNQKRSHDQVDEAESDEDDYAPPLPPDMMLPSSASAAASGTASAGSKVTLGPSRPLLNQAQQFQNDDESDDDQVGPLPAAPSTSQQADDDHEDAVAAFREREARLRDQERRDALEASRNAKPKRDEWMLAPPTSSNLLSSIDPTKLKSRSFNTKPTPSSSSNKKGKKGEVSDLWTETPEERQNRLRDEAMGVRRPTERGNGQDDDDDDDDDDDGGNRESRDERRRKRERDEQLRSQVEKYNSKSRSKTLLDMHGNEGKNKKRRTADGKDADDAPPGIWDRERDMGIRGGIMDPNKRRDMIQGAKELGGRFGGGSFL